MRKSARRSKAQAFAAAVAAAMATWATPLGAHGAVVRKELVIRNEPMNMSGVRAVDFALTVNGSIPAPTLEFDEGDDAEILVKNELASEEVSVHWHGLLLPPEEDGVAHVNTPPIRPKSSRLFRFKIRQSGTFWYHSHTALQEQKGVFGAFVIRPKRKPVAYDREAVVVLSDWTDESPDQVLRNLRKDGDYYLYKKNSVRSYWGAVQAGSLRPHLANEWSRMGGMDPSDVGYDAFLINGRRESKLAEARPGERIRLRIVNAGASTYFRVSLAGAPMTAISADGVDVEPVRARELLMGMAETYDVLFTVPEAKSYELRATAQDGTGYASFWIGEGEKVAAPAPPPLNLYATMDHGAGHEGQGSHGHGHDGAQAHEPALDRAGARPHAHEPARGRSKAHAHAAVRPIDWSSQSDAVLRQNAAPRSWALDSAVVDTLTVDSLRALEPTTLPLRGQVHDVKLVLGGDMRRYVWHLNGKAIHQDRLLLIKTGDVVRFTFDNGTMMHHPMHFHGHFFRVLNAGGDRSPLKHTVDVPPHGSRTIEFVANEPGQWMLHCHNLYHMKTGMARVVRYEDFPLTDAMRAGEAHDPHGHDHLYSWALLEAASNHAQAQLRLSKTWDEIALRLESADVRGRNFSWDGKWETEADAFYRRWLTNYLHLRAGASLYDDKAYGAAGFGYTLPMMLEVAATVNHLGRPRFDLERRFQWTRSWFTNFDLAWRPNWGGDRDFEFEASLMYGPSWAWAAGLMVTEKSVGFGAQAQF